MSRPPSGITPKKFIKEKTNESPIKSSPAAVVDDDELPPRMENAKSSPNPGSTSLPDTGRNTRTPSRPSTPQQTVSSASALPIHAGFDLMAIKATLKQVEQDLDSRSEPSSSTPATPSLKRPNRSTLVPPQFPHRAHSVPESHTSLHQRSNSLDDGSAVVPPEVDRGPRMASLKPIGNEAPVGSPFSQIQNQAFFLSSPRGDVVPSWGTPKNISPTTAKPSTTSFSSLPTPSLNSYTFGNPFASPGHDRTPVLSFGIGGEPDAKPFNQDEPTKGYAWDLPPLGAEKKSTGTLDTALGANPWS